MTGTVQKIWIGLDWGTHSSKWWYTAEDTTGAQVQSSRVEAVIESTIHRSGNRLKMLRERTRTQSEVQDARLKRLLLKDPQGASYWDALRDGIRVSLGEASALSLSTLLGDVAEHIANSQLELTQNCDIELRFSLPNWIGDDLEHRTAHKRMFQTAVAVTGLLGELGFAGLPRVGQETDVDEWRTRVGSVLRTSGCRALFELTSPNPEETFCVLPRQNIRFRLVAESCAAGFPQLEQLLIPADRPSKTQDHWVKLLVVDVGAGSTDAGYFISSRRINGDLLLNYLKPARTLDYAGEQLTEMIREFYYRTKNRDMTIQEAEILKLGAPDEWKDQQFVSDWTERIAKSVASYIFYVPDEARLGETSIPGLKILMTGGSGLVGGIGNAIREQVVDALMRRGVASNVASRTEVLELTLDWPEDRIDRARRAVSIGAGSGRLAQLKFREALVSSPMGPGKLQRW